MSNLINPVVKIYLDDLGDQELAAFGVCLGWPDQKKACEGKPWFSKIEPLFIEGDKLHPSTFDAVLEIINQRIRKGGK